MTNLGESFSFRRTISETKFYFTHSIVTRDLISTKSNRHGSASPLIAKVIRGCKFCARLFGHCIPLPAPFVPCTRRLVSRRLCSILDCFLCPTMTLRNDSPSISAGDVSNLDEKEGAHSSNGVAAAGSRRRTKPTA